MDDDVQCANYELCQQSAPRWLIDSRRVPGLCVTCDIHVCKVLEFSTIDQCCICLDEQVRGTGFWNCVHMICLKCHFLSLSYDDKPQCLHPDLSVCECAECAMMDKWDDEYDRQQNIRSDAVKTCPLCRGDKPKTY